MAEVGGEAVGTLTPSAGAAVEPLWSVDEPVVVIAPGHRGREAWNDIVRGVRLYRVWTQMALHEIRQRFRRSVLGPLWLTLSMGIFVGALGLVYSALFRQDIAHLLPYVAVGVICWGLLTSCINEGSNIFIGHESFIKNVPLPLSVQLFRMLARNVIIWCFNMAIYLGVLVVFHIPVGLGVLLFIPGFVLFMLNAAWMGLAAGILSTRYRDVPQVISSLVQITFFVTPVFWSPETLPRRAIFVEWNPLYHVLELVRAPLLGQPVTELDWAFGLGLAIVGVGITALLYRRAYARIPYWV